MDEPLTRLQPTQTQAAAALLARAFAEDPIYVKLVPDPVRRLRSGELMFRGVLTYVLRYGEVWTTEKLWGVACWLPPGDTTVTLWRNVRTGFALAWGMRGYPRAARRTLLRAFASLDKLHAQLVPEPHWYLWVLGVDPDRQGHGVGSALLRSVLARADADRKPCYLETETAWNVAFYRRRGFEVIREEIMSTSGMPVWLMVRRPQI